MSRWQGLHFRGRLLCANTTALQAYLGLLVHFGRGLEAADEAWFADALEHWRVQAGVPDLGMTLNDDWTEEQRGTVVALASSARAAISTPECTALLSDERWQLGDIVVADGAVDRDALPDRVRQVADGVVALLDGTLSPDPPTGSWLVGATLNDWSVIPNPST